jgi:hypothetical protein
VQCVQEEAKVFFRIFLMSALESQLHPLLTARATRSVTQNTKQPPTLIESNRLFSFIASYTFSGTNASFLASFSRASVLGVDVPEVGGVGSCAMGVAPEDCGDATNSRRKMILLCECDHQRALAVGNSHSLEQRGLSC